MNKEGYRKISKKSFLCVFSSTMLFITLITCPYIYLSIYTTPLSKDEKTISINLEKGHNFNSFLDQIQEYRPLAKPLIVLWAKSLNYTKNIKAGFYEVSLNQPLNSIVETLVSGDTKKYNWTVIEGQNKYDMENSLQSATDLIYSSDVNSDQNLLQTLNCNNTIENIKSIEGLLLPETYKYQKNDNHTQLIKQANTSLCLELNNAWTNRNKTLPYKNPYQLLIAASLIEKETKYDDEKLIISGIIASRLLKKMKLEIDASVRYGVKYFTKRLRKSHLKKKTPYNIYLNHGLPQTPICMPSKSSIYAASQPQMTEYLYYVLSPDNKHKFSKTYREHLAAVKIYRKWLRNKKHEK